MNKLKVLHVVHDFLHGGIEAFIYYLSQAQLKNDAMDLTILCCQKKELVANKRILGIQGLNILYIKVDAFDLNLSSYSKIIAIANGYDVVHVHTFKPLLCYALSFSKAKLVYTMHSAGEVNRISNFTSKLKEKMLIRFLNKKVDLILNNSNYTQQYWLNKGVKPRPNMVMYNGVYMDYEVDKERLLTEFPILSGKFVVGTSSRFIPWKRVDRLIEAFGFFVKDKPDAMLLLVGDGTERERLEMLVAKLQITDKVLFAGFKPKVQDFQVGMNVCVFPSVSEPFGLVAIECLSLGKPTLVFNDGGGITELLNMIEPDNVVTGIKDLAGKLQGFYDKRNESVSESMIASRKQFAAEFDVFKIESRLFDAYKMSLS